jgi:hypothetical protein
MDSAAILSILKRAFDAFLRDILPLIVAGFFVSLLTGLTLGILGGPLLAGLYRMVSLRLREGREPQFGDVFYFDRFLQFVLAFYALVILIAIGFAFFILPGLFLATIWFYVFPLMVERELGLGDAMRESKALADRVGLAQQFTLTLVLLLLGAVLSALTDGLSSIFFTPFAAVYVLTALRDVEAGPREAEG